MAAWRSTSSANITYWDDPELGLVVNVVVEDCGSESAKLADSSGDSVGSRTNGSREALGGDEEGNAVCRRRRVSASSEKGRQQNPLGPNWLKNDDK